MTWNKEQKDFSAQSNVEHTGAKRTEGRSEDRLILGEEREHFKYRHQWFKRNSCSNRVLHYNEKSMEENREKN